MRRILIGIAGETASGKTTATKHIQRRWGGYACRTSDPLREHAKQTGRPTDKASLQQIFLELRDMYDRDDVIWHLLMERIVASNAQYIVVEGCRKPVDIQELIRLSEELEAELLLFYFEADSVVRFNRFNRRARTEGSPLIDWNAFTALEQHECERDLADIKTQIAALSGTMIDTTKASIETVCQRVDYALGKNQ